MNLEKKVQEWIEAGYLTSVSGKKILDSERKEHKSVFSLVFLLIGALCIGVGAIALISSNWWQIPNAVKLAVDFIILFGLSGASFYAWKKGRSILLEVLLFSLAIFTMASIGLIAQIFHLYSGWYNGALFWGALVLPLAILSRKMLLFFFWIPVVSSAFFFKLATYPWFQHFIERIFKAVPPVVTIPMAFLSLAFVIGLVRFIFKGRGRTFVVPLFFWKTFGALGAVFLLDGVSAFTYRFFSYSDVTRDPTAVTIFYLFFAAMTAATFFLWGLNKRVSKEQRKTFFVMESIFAALLLVSGFVEFYGMLLRLFIVAMVLAFLFSGAFFSFFQNKRKLFYFFGTLIGIRFVLIYFEVFKSILFTGWVLILSGVVIILTVVFGVKVLKFFTSFLPKKGDRK